MTLSLTLNCSSVCVSTCRCRSVNSTGLVRNTRLDSLFMEAEMMWELTARPCPPNSPCVFTVAF
uniref:Uncharacterized protein n=1 Tax=Cyprinus carpio TaxID=7962 RepID=A0A8C1LI81_CYPCA